jgi:hypothetical protein
MNVEIGTEAPIYLFWEYLFRNFGILSLQCIPKYGPQEDTETPQNEVPLALSQSGMISQHVVPPLKYEKIESYTKDAL